MNISCQKILSRLLTGIVMLLVTLAATRISVVQASGGIAHFSIQPTFQGIYRGSARANFVYNSHPGAKLYDAIHVTNTGTARGTVNLYPVDGTTLQTSGIGFLPRTAPRSDVGSWIALSRQQLTLNPGQSQEVPFTLTIPQHTRPGQHEGGIVAEDMTPPQFTASPQQGTTIHIGIQTLLILGALINLPGQQVEKLQATSIQYDTKSDYQRLLVGLGNTGTQIIHPSGSLQVLDNQGRQVQNIAIKMRGFLPQTSINYPVYIQHTALPLGKNYTAKLHLQYENNNVLDFVTAFSVPLPPVKATLASTVQDLVKAPLPTLADFFGQLTPWHYAAGILALFSCMGGLVWRRKISGGIARIVRRR
ncbi:MAG TPA: DUF916 domain-containing protein [Ktedonosporobacter sp.]|jgi:hypothetical protein|nr:DUF916 domain-containing protein [Ktedonosporobacter sp.]